MGGQFLPLAKWRHDGFDDVAIAARTVPEDITEDDVLGTCYRVKIMSTYDAGEKTTDVGDETKAKMDVENVVKQVLSSLGATDPPDVAPVEPKSNSSSSSSSSDSSSSSRKKSKKKKKSSKENAKNAKKGSSSRKKSKHDKKRKMAELDREDDKKSQGKSV